MSGYNASRRMARLIRSAFARVLLVALPRRPRHSRRHSTPPPETRAEATAALARRKSRSRSRRTSRTASSARCNTVETRVLSHARARRRASEVRQPRDGQRIRIRCRLPQSPAVRSRRRAQRLGAPGRSRNTGRSKEGSTCRVSPAGWLTFGTYARHQDYPQEDFFGIGPDSRRDEHTSFRIVNTMVGRARRREARADR